VGDEVASLKLGELVGGPTVVPEDEDDEVEGEATHLELQNVGRCDGVRAFVCEGPKTLKPVDLRQGWRLSVQKNSTCGQTRRIALSWVSRAQPRAESVSHRSSRTMMRRRRG